MKFPMKKTTADVPPGPAAEFIRTPRPQAVAEAMGDGYTETAAMRKGLTQKGQFGLPKSGKKPPFKK